MYTLEARLWHEGFAHIAGVDEVGRGPLAGPVAAAAVILPRAPQFDTIRDSKALSARQRERFYDLIMHSAVAVSIAFVDERTIDQINIYQATRRAMREALATLHTAPDCALIDGRMTIPARCRTWSIVRGDTTSASIAAAAIVAKVRRDRLMFAYHEQYPEYGFDRHKGYPTKAHIHALDRHGPCPIHRVSFRPIRERCLV